MRLRLKRYLPGLNDPCPSFLDLTSTRPFQAARELYAFAFRLMQVAPPAVYRTLPHDLSMDMLYDVALTCIRSGFTGMESFVPSERPFAHWLRGQFKSICPRWQSQLSALVSPDVSLPLIQYDEKGKVQRLDPAQLARQVRLALDACKAEDRLLLELSVYDFRPWEVREIFRWRSVSGEEILERRRPLRTMLTEGLREAGFQLAWDDRQLNQLIRLAHTLWSPAVEPEESIIRSYCGGQPGDEIKAEVIEGMSNSSELVLKVLDMIVDQWERFPDELAVGFAGVQVGCTPDYAAFLTPAQPKPHDIKKMWPF